MLLPLCILPGHGQRRAALALQGQRRGGSGDVEALAAGEQAVPAINHFGMLTVLEGELSLVWQGGKRVLKRGESLYVPCASPALTLMGNGRAALSMPR